MHLYGLLILLQIPPTPSPLPPSTPIVSLNSFSLWAGTSTAIQTWRWTQPRGQVIQMLLVVVIVLVGVAIVWKFIRDMTRKDEAE